MGEVLGLVSGAVSVVSGIGQAVSARSQQRAAASYAQQSMALAQEQAEADNQAAREDAASEEFAIRKDLNTVLASQRAIMGASGAMFDSPTNEAIAEETRGEAERDTLTVRSNLGRTIAASDRNLRAQAMGARESVRAANAGALAAYGGAVGSIITGAGRLNSYIEAREERQFIEQERARQANRARRS